MQSYKYQIPELPGFTVVIAIDEASSRKIHDTWYECRFDRKCEAFEASNVDPGVCHPAGLDAAIAKGVEGIATWMGDVWVITPPTMELPGYRWLDPRPVKLWQVISGDECLSVFAATPADAILLFATWWNLHIALPFPPTSIEEQNPAVLRPERFQVWDQMKLGAVGIGSDMVMEWKILPPYDHASGDL